MEKTLLFISENFNPVTLEVFAIPLSALGCVLAAITIAVDRIIQQDWLVYLLYMLIGFIAASMITGITGIVLSI